ncbi:cache domain-containing protein [Sulfurovum sp.]|uniref:sensor histidine kinase n=1 Tax=Sulfurovum sp. TaxID=1969726 RepID=UPI0025F52615|nr:cache domain-containing protein [Sulfurovum sp.]
MRWNVKPSFRLTTLIVLFPLVALLLYGGLSHLFFFYSQRKEIKREALKYEQTLMDMEGNRLRDRVENMVQFVRYYDSKSSNKIKKDAKSIVNLAVNVTNNLYAKYKDTLDENALKKMIISALEGIKFEGDLGYLFLIDMQGNIFVHIDPEMVGTNIMNIQDVQGKYIVREFTKVLREKGEGFVDYYWYIVSEDRKEMHYKISYVKLLDCYNWYVGAGEYLKYMKRDVRKDILTYIKDNHQFTDGYFFVSNSKHKIIYAPDDINTSGETKKGFLARYVQKGLYRDKHYMAYTDYIPEYDWYITAVENLKSIQKNSDFQKKQNELKREANIKINYYLMLFTWVISILLSLYLSSILNRKLKNYESRLKETNEKLVFQSRQALLGELLPMIAHQWRQPINKIASILALLRFNVDKKVGCDKLDAYYKDMENNIEFMSETIDDFRTFYQPKDQSSVEDLKALILKSIEFVEGSIRKKDIQLYTQLEEVSYSLYQNEFLQVMINLIKNAVDSLPVKGKIKVVLNQKNHIVTIIVEDNGKGIDPQNIEKVFDPYFTTKEDSMGLGLYMTKIIIEKHMSGTVRIEQLSPGTRFIIELYQNT